MFTFSLYHDRLFCFAGMNGQGIGTSSFADYCKRLDNLPLTKDERDDLDNRYVAIHVIKAKN